MAFSSEHKGARRFITRLVSSDIMSSGHTLRMGTRLVTCAFIMELVLGTVWTIVFARIRDNDDLAWQRKASYTAQVRCVNVGSG